MSRYATGGGCFGRVRGAEGDQSTWYFRMNAGEYDTRDDLTKIAGIGSCTAFSAGGRDLRCLTRCAMRTQPNGVLRVAPVVEWLQSGGNNRGRGDGWSYCGVVPAWLGSVPTFRRPVRPTADVGIDQPRVSNNETSFPTTTQVPLTTALSWDWLVRCPWTMKASRARPSLTKTSGTRPRWPRVGRSVASIWIGDRTSDGPQNAHRLNKGPYSHRLTIAISADFLELYYTPSGSE